MILLSPEEIASIKTKQIKPINTFHRQPLIDMQLEAVALAQLKQVVEWLEQFHVKVIEGDPSDLHARISDCGYRLSVKDVQALKKEVNDERQETSRRPQEA